VCSKSIEFNHLPNPPLPLPSKDDVEAGSESGLMMKWCLSLIGLETMLIVNCLEATSLLDVHTEMMQPLPLSCHLYQ